MPETEFVPFAPVGAIDEKSFKCGLAGNVPVVVCRFRDEYFALRNLCSHALATFDDGRMRGYRLMCPLHGATFDIRDGAVTGAPAVSPVTSFPVRINAGMIEVDITLASGEEE